MSPRIRKFVSLISALLLLGVAAWFKFFPSVSAVSGIPDAVSAEGFRFRQDAGVLILHGVKSADMGLEIATRFDSMYPPCRGMFATDTGDTNLVSKPGAGARGDMRKLYYLEEGRAGDYEMRIPLQVTHPECTWRLAELEFKARGSFSVHRVSAYQKGGDRVDGAQFLHWGFFMRQHMESEGAVPDRWNFPEQIDAQCYNGIFMNTRIVKCGAPGWRRHTSFPQAITEVDQTMTLNLILHDGVIMVEEWQKQGKKLPWYEVPESKGNTP